MNDFIKQLIPSLHLMWRRRWNILLVAWLLCVAGWIFVAVLPNKYESTVRIYVDTDSMLRPLLSGIAVETNPDRELEVMQRTLLSQPNLEEVIRVTDLGLEVNTAVEREELIRKLWLKIDVLSEKKNLFEIKYSHPSAETARQVVQSLLTIFVEANLGESRREMDDARRFIDEQIN